MLISYRENHEANESKHTIAGVDMKLKGPNRRLFGSTQDVDKQRMKSVMFVHAGIVLEPTRVTTPYIVEMEPNLSLAFQSLDICLQDSGAEKATSVATCCSRIGQRRKVGGGVRSVLTHQIAIFRPKFQLWCPVLWCPSINPPQPASSKRRASQNSHSLDPGAAGEWDMVP